MTWRVVAILLTFLLAFDIIALLTFRDHRHAACGAAATSNDFCVLHWLDDVPDYAEHLLGFVFDLEEVGRDADRRARRWDIFGGCNVYLDGEIEEMWPLATLAELI